MTVLFADVVGSTPLAESMDPEDFRRLLARFYAIASEVIAEHGGTLEKFIGDAAMAIFGIPQAHDDDARRALDAALDLREQLRGDPMLGDRLPIRIGLNTGEVVASRDPERIDFIVTGDAVNVAARLQQAAEPWQILASGRTASADLGVHAFGPAVQLDVKGKRAPVEARELAGMAEARASRTPLVGRDADLAQLDLVAQRAFSERQPHLVTIIAPAGTGKTRLVEEFLGSLQASAPDAAVAIAQCLPYGQRLTYWPMRALLFGIVGLDDDASPETLRRATHDWLAAAGAIDPARTTELLAATIGASDVDAMERGLLFNAWREMLELAAAARPLVLLIEDLHWSSDSLLDLLDHVLQPRGEIRLLMLALARPELLERRPTWGGGRRNHLSLALAPLSDAAVRDLVGDLLEAPAPGLVQIVVDRAEGNPFYAGEIVRSLIERGVDIHDPDAVIAGARDLPDTVQATVLARLDLLPPLPRRVLQLGAVLGRSFAAEGVQTIGSIEPEAAASHAPASFPAIGAVDGDGAAGSMTAALDLLLERDLLRGHPGGVLTFRHILIRDVAYGTLPRSERATLHAAAASWLEGQAIGREDEMAELVAFHYREAAVLQAATGLADAELAAAAVRWLRRAADVAAAARGIVEAAGHLRGALELATPDELPRLHQMLAELYQAGDQAVANHELAWQLGERQGMPADFLLENLARQIMVQCRFFASVAHPPSEAEIDELVTRGMGWVDAASERPRAIFYIALGFRPFMIRQTGERALTDEDLARAADFVRRGLAVAERLDDPTLVSAALDAMTTSHIVDWQKTLELSRRRTAMGERLPVDERLDALNMVAWSSVLLGDLPPAIEHAELAIALVQPGRNAGFGLAGHSWNAYARALRGEWEPLRTSLEGLRRFWLESDRPAAAYGLQGILSGVDWARNRGEEAVFDRWRDMAEEIVTRFATSHPVHATRAALDLDPEGMAAMVRDHARYPDRAHYIEHVVGLCADRHIEVDGAVLAELLERARASRLRVLEGQVLRLRGTLADDPVELAASRAIFRDVGAARYEARAAGVLASLTGDGDGLAAARETLAAMGEEAMIR